ncbi:hypothetical protein [Arthrobacter sp. H16F315]|jgi:hypothetical protein|nr:hypothetical protein [Arthrobacter sp. H16F315]MDD1478739.1 hypothetical protein [Arthrobacter sp. H16F315]MDD1478786.1 hypothetical protein [Arthrobacter sp. H16F315]
MNGRQRDLSGAPAGSVFNLLCPAARRAGCSLRTAALNAGPGRTGLKESLTECEIDIFLSLVRGDRVVVRDHETGALWGGWIDMTFSDHGFIWVITDVGERKLLDIGVHTLWRPEESGACGSVRREAGRLEDDRALTTDISPGN